MRRTWLGIACTFSALAAAAATAACGEGRAIFNIDVFSFLQSSNVDTIPYFAPLPPGSPDTIPVQQVQLLPIGLGGSTVDTVLVVTTLDFVNSNGTGTVGFAVYIDSVPNVYARPPAFVIPPVNVTGTTTSQGTLTTELASLRQLFSRAALYVGARVTATASVPPVQGVARVTGLDLRIVLQEQIF